MTPPPAPVGTAGSAGDGYRTAQPEHPWKPARRDPGERGRCQTCGAETHERRDVENRLSGPVPSPRSTDSDPALTERQTGSQGASGVSET